MRDYKSTENRIWMKIILAKRVRKSLIHIEHKPKHRRNQV
jgi:hypothetical protein